VELSCHRCHASLPEGASYCSHCGSPQIRVPAPEPEEAGATSQALPLPDSSASLYWRTAVPIAAKVGIVTAVVLNLPLVGFLFPAWILLSGWIAVRMYIRRVPTHLIGPTGGGALGALTGFMSFLFVTALTSAYFWLKATVFHQGEELRQGLRDLLQQAAAGKPDGQQLLQMLDTPTGLATLMAMGLIVLLVLFLLFSSVGGLFATISLRRRRG
jgi:ribosomal protein L40E